MTHAAIGELGDVDVIAAHEGVSLGELVCGWLPRHVENLVFGADELGGVSVTIQTPFHVKRVLLPGERHLVHRPMAGFAADSFADVNAVIEEHKIRQVVNPIPVDAFVVGQTFPHGSEQRRLRP